MMKALQSRRAAAWEEFAIWARAENEYQKVHIGSHPSDHPNADLRNRTYFEVNLYRYFHALRACWKYLDRPRQKVLDVGSWPGCWLRVMGHFAKQRSPEIWGTGLIVRDDFVPRMGGACRAAVRCELDVWSPMADREAPSVITENGFTLVTAMEVVEHLYHPEWMFRMLSDIMAPGGILFLTTNNAARMGNIVGMLRGEGMAGNLDELLPRNGGQLGAWRPHAREYVWRELNNVAGKCGFMHVKHGFYQENYNKRLLEGIEQPSENVEISEGGGPLLDAMQPLLAERDQLKSGMYLVLKKTGRVTQGIRKLKSGLHQVYRETGLKSAVEKRVVKWVNQRRISENGNS